MVYKHKFFFKQRFNYSKIEKINFISGILKLECLFYQYIYIFYLIFFYICRAITTQTNPNSVLGEKKTYQLIAFKSSILYY
jgi:hypothetical protein